MSENKMTATPWRIEDCKEELVITRGDISYGIASCYCDPMDNETRANAAAIVSAINWTYGIGVNPEAVGDLWDIANQYMHYLEGIRGGLRLSTIEKENYIKCKAAIEKAKLKPI